MEGIYLSKLVPKRPGPDYTRWAYAQWGLSSEYYGMLDIQYFNSCKLFLKLQLLVNKDNWDIISELNIVF